MCPTRIFAGLLMLLSLPVLADDVYIRADADSYAAPVPIKAFINNWNAPLRSGDNAFLDARVESGVSLGDYRIAYVWSDDYLLHFSPETAALYNDYKHDLPPARGANPVLLNVHQIEAQGLHLARRFTLGAGQPAAQPWTLEVGLNLLEGQALTQGELAGTANFVGPGFGASDVGSLNAGVDYHYSHPALHEGDLGWYPQRPQGQGASLDLGLRGDLSPRLHAQLQFDNLAGHMFWGDVPATRYNLACQCAQGRYDISGQLQIDHRLRQALSWTGRGALDYDLAAQPWYLDATAFANPWNTLLAAGAGYRWPAVNLKAALEPQTHSLLIDASFRHGGLRWQSDAWDPTRAHRLGLSLYGAYAW